MTDHDAVELNHVVGCHLPNDPPETCWCHWLLDSDDAYLNGHYAKEPHRFVPMSLPDRFEDCFWCAQRRDHWVHRPMETQDDPCGKFLSGDPDHPQMCVRCGFGEDEHR